MKPLCHIVAGQGNGLGLIHQGKTCRPSSLKYVGRYLRECSRLLDFARTVHGAVSPPDQESGSLSLREGSHRTHGLAKPLAHTRPSRITGQMVLLAETALPLRFLEVFQYGTNLCESGTHPFPQGLLIL